MRTLLLTSLLFTATLSAADFSGTWLGEVPFGFNGDYLRMSQQVAIKLVQDGTTLTGKQYSDYETPPIIEGKVSGDQVDFVVIAQEQQSNQIIKVRLHFTGTLKADDTLEITRTHEAATNAGNAGTYKIKEANAKQTFILRRIP